MSEISDFERAALTLLAIWRVRECDRGGRVDTSSNYFDLLVEAFEVLQLAAELDKKIMTRLPCAKPDTESTHLQLIPFGHIEVPAS